GAIHNLKLTEIMKALFDDVYTISNYCSWPNFVWDYWVIYDTRDFHSTVYRRTAEICYKAVCCMWELAPGSTVLDAADEAGLLADLDPASCALHLSQAGDHAGCFFTVLPTAPEFNVPDPHFRVAALRRLRVPLPFSERVCPCQGALDALGGHRAACARAGVLGLPLERTAARICREAGARVAENVLLRDLNLDAPVRPFDAASATTLASGAGAAACLSSASRSVAGGSRKSRRVPELLRGAAVQAYVWRWTALLAVAAQRALAASLLQLLLFGEMCVDGAEPPVSDLLADARWESGPVP
ncbi:unnamed protein product, partial [Effrenium voratum]